MNRKGPEIAAPILKGATTEKRYTAIAAASSEEFDKDALAIAAWILQGRSIVDFIGKTVTTHESYVRLLKANGFDVVKNRNDRKELDDIKEEALAFTEAQFKLLHDSGNLDKSLPAELDEHVLCADVKELFEIASGTYKPALHPNVARQAGVVLKYIFVVCYARRNPEALFKDQAYEVLKQFMASNFRNKDDGSWEFIANPDTTIVPKVAYVQHGKKSRASTVKKLMTKDDVTAANMVDHCRARIVVETPLDILKLLYVLVRECRIPWNNSLSRKPKQELLDFKKIGLLLKDPAKAADFIGRLMEDPDAIDGVRVQQKGKGKKKDGEKGVNPSSSDHFQCVSWIVELPVPVQVVIDGELCNRVINYPFEFQFADRKTAERNWNPAKSDVWDSVGHEVYEERQGARIGARLRITGAHVKAVVGAEEVEGRIKDFQKAADALRLPQGEVAVLVSKARAGIADTVESTEGTPEDIMVARFRELGIALGVAPGLINKAIEGRGPRGKSRS